MNPDEQPGSAPTPPNWLTEAWDDYIESLPRLLPVVILAALLNAPTFLLVKSNGAYLQALLYMGLILTPLTIGSNLCYIRAVRRKGDIFPALFSGFAVYPRALAVSFGLGLMTLGGTLLLVVPGAVIYSTYCFSEYAVVERRAGIKESFQFSAAITSGWRIPVFMLVLLTVIGEFVVPNPVYITGSLSAPQVKTDLRAWVLTAFALKTLFYLPWLRLALARAYVFLSSGPRQPG